MAVRFLLLLLLASPLWPQLMVDTFAGGKIRSGVPAQDVALSQVRGLTWDSAGNVVFCEVSTNLIRRVRPDGIIETVAGNGTTGFSGDGGPALNAALNEPASPRYDAQGNLYFADVSSHRIRRIDTRGVITSIAGTGVWLWPGMDLEGPAIERPLDIIVDLAVDPAGNVCFTERSSNLVRRVTAAGRIEIFARAAEFLSPGWLAFDSAGNLYVAEGMYSNGARIRRIAPDGVVTKVAGYGTSTGTTVADDGKPALDVYMYQLTGLAAGAEGSVYLVQVPLPGGRSTIGNRLRVIDANGVLTTLAGGRLGGSSPDGAALPSAISPYGLAADARGNLAFADTVNAAFASAVRVVTSQSQLKTLAGGTPKPAPAGISARDGWLWNPSAIAFNSAAELLIAEMGPCLIRKVGADGLLATVAGTGKCGAASTLQPSTSQDMAPPVSIAIDSQNRLYVVDLFGNSYVIASDGKIAPVAFPPALGQGKIAVDAKDRVYMLSLTSLARVSPDGKIETIVGPPRQAGVPPPGFGPTLMRAIGTDASRNVYFTGEYLGDPTSSIFRVNDDGTFVKLFNGVYNELALAVDSGGSVWLADGRVSVVNASGRWGFGNQEGGYAGDGGLAQTARFNTTALDRAPNGDLYLLDNGRVRRLTGTAPPSAPAIASGGIVNAASLAGGAIASGELLSIFGSNFGTSALRTNAPENNRIPWGLGQTKVLFDGFPGAITAVTPNQINVFVPTLVEPGRSVDVVVQVDSAASAAVRVPVAASAFGLSTADQSGSGPGAILNQDGSVNSSFNPAPRGSVVGLFGTGEGETVPRLLWGDLSISTPYSTPTQQAIVIIGGLQAQVLYAGAAPLLPAGVLQINARIPTGINPGTAPVLVLIGGVPTSKPVTVAVR
jgi:trimeric autotransporter adhesin